MAGCSKRSAIYPAKKGLEEEEGMRAKHLVHGFTTPPPKILALWKRTMSLTESGERHSTTNPTKRVKDEFGWLCCRQAISATRTACARDSVFDSKRIPYFVGCLPQVSPMCARVGTRRERFVSNNGLSLCHAGLISFAFYVPRPRNTQKSELKQKELVWHLSSFGRTFPVQTCYEAVFFR